MMKPVYSPHLSLLLNIWCEQGGTIIKCVACGSHCWVPPGVHWPEECESCFGGGDCFTISRKSALPQHV